VRQEEWLLEEIRLRLPALEAALLTRDCVVPGGCSKYRHDALFMFGCFALAIEIDEFAHRHEDRYDRLVQLQRDHGHQASLVVRINPNHKDRPMMRRRVDRATGEFRGWEPSRWFDGCMDTVCDWLEAEVLSAADGVPAMLLGRRDVVIERFFF
jgi:hypothetical protein